MSKIEWTEKTWNPIIGCSKVSPGCENCYAERTAVRLSRVEKTAYYGKVVEDGEWNGTVIVVPSQLKKPMKRKKPTIYFVGSMCDLFHDNAPVKNLNDVFWVMGMCSQHRFIVLTKRAEQMQWYMSLQKTFCEKYKFPYPLPNVILGVTAENQEQADKRIPILLDTPAAARFVSVEPMLGPVDLTAYMDWTGVVNGHEIGINKSKYTPWVDGLNWVICGGESGPGARPMHPGWARGLRDQCKEAGVPFFFKQWGEWTPMERCRASHMIRNDSGHVMNYVTPAKTTDDFWEPISRVGKKKAGNILNGQLHEEYPEILREVKDA